MLIARHLTPKTQRAEIDRSAGHANFGFAQGAHARVEALMVIALSAAHAAAHHDDLDDVDDRAAHTLAAGGVGSSRARLDR